MCTIIQSELPPAEEVLAIRGARPWQATGGRRVAARLAAAGLLTLCAPVLLIMFACIRLSSSGPAIYRQRRVGLRGRCFVLYKLRTMYDGAEAASGPVWASPEDPRITPLGRLLRCWHLDELPQLWNIVRGEMAIVGPRPERPEIIASLLSDLPNYEQRLLVLPGITGLAQIHLPADTSVESVLKKLRMDLAYADRRSFWLDCRIVFCTTLKLFGVNKPSAARIAGLSRLLTEYSEQDSSASHSLNAPRKAPHSPGWKADRPRQSSADSLVAVERRIS